MKSRPIIMRADEVRAIIDGRKTQLRRPIKPQPVLTVFPSPCWWEHTRKPWMPIGGVHQDRWKCPYGQPRDRLWVRETWRIGMLLGMHQGQENPIAIYRADGEIPFPWRPSVHMPRWASRITLEIVRVRVERVRSITRGDAMAEGCPFANMAKGPDPRMWFANAWQSTHGTWNLWVWVVEFRRVEK